MKSLYRPKLKLPLSNFEIVIEVVCVLLLIILFSGLIRVSPQLSESIVSHFNAKGEPDAYSNSNSIFIPAFIALGIYLLLTLMNRFPHLYNFPIKITEDNAMVQYQLARNYLGVLKLSIIIIFAIIVWNSVHLSIDKSKTILQGYSFLAFLSLILVVPFAYYLFQAKQNK